MSTDTTSRAAAVEDPAPAAAAPGKPAGRRFGGHMPSLDGVRGLAILAVLLFHFVANSVATNGFERAVNKVLNYGSLGVDLFFVLSGFLITGILYDARESPHYFRISILCNGCSPRRSASRRSL